MLVGALVALFYGLVAVIGAMSALALCLMVGKGLS